MNSYTVFWLVLAVIFGIIEAATPTLTTIWMVVAAMCTAVLTVWGVTAIPQFLIFAIISAILVAFTRPLAKKVLSQKTIPTNADRIIQAKGVVIKTISSIDNSGQIKIMGQIWSAKSENDEEISEGVEVVVTRLEGARAVVEKIKELQIV